MKERDQSLVDSVMKSGRPLSDLRPAFPTWEAALQYYGQKQSHTHCADQPSDTCEACGAPSPEMQHTISWAAMVYKARWLFWSFLVSLVTSLFDFTIEKSLCISFETHHRICARCNRGLKVKQALHGLLKPLLFGLLILSLIALVPTLVFGAYLGQEAGLIGILTFLAGAVVLLALFVGLVAICSRIPNIVVPKQFRLIGRRPFVMVAIKRSG